MVDPGGPRRLVLVVLSLLATVGATRLLASILAANGLSLIEIAILTLFALTFGWITIAFWTALVGYLMIVTRRRGPAAATPADAEGVDPVRERTALIMPVYHEDADEVGLRIRA
ncbi:MAG TPA: hypothetical protein VFZ01_12010, partial [Geminicoccaceae bacterium]